MVHLRMAAFTELLKDVSGHCLALNSYGHSFEFPGTGPNVLGLCASREELELRISGALQVLGRRRFEAVVHTRRQQHSHGHRLHGCAFDLPIQRTAFEKNTMGYTCGVPA